MDSLKMQRLRYLESKNFNILTTERNYRINLRKFGSILCSFVCLLFFYFQVNSWGSWGVCSEKCAVGTKQRTRTVKISKRCRGRDCPALRVRIYCHIFEVTQAKTLRLHWCCWCCCFFFTFNFLKKFVDNLHKQEKHRLIIPFLHVEKFYLDIFSSNGGYQLTYFGIVDLSECWQMAFRALV